MRPTARFAAALALVAAGALAAQSVPDNPAIDMPEFLRLAHEAAELRQVRRLTEEQFLERMAVPGTIVLDARSRDKYELLHVAGAVNLPFTDITVESLARLVPDRSTPILIYCNNNFAEAEAAFPEKRASAALNLSTYVTLHSYGYENVWELGPQVELAKSKLPFESSPGFSS
jgi:hypothetical protein